MPDLDGDRVPDLAVRHFDDVTEAAVVAYSTATGDVPRSWPTPQAGGWFAFGRDVDGDGVADGIAGGAYDAESDGLAVVMLAVDGTVRASTPGRAAAIGPDATGDGLADIVVAGGGRLSLASVAAGSVHEVWSHEVESDESPIGFAVALDDFDGDGLSDVVASDGELRPRDAVPGDGALYLFSSRDR